MSAPACDADGLTTEAIAERIGVTRRRVDQIITVALQGASGDGERLLGQRRAAPVIASLRGQPLHTFQRTLQGVRDTCT